MDRGWVGLGLGFRFVDSPPLLRSRNATGKRHVGRSTRAMWTALGKDGGVFAFGDAGYAGSLPGEHVHVSDIVGIAPTPDGAGYLLVDSGGGVFPFGSASSPGSLPALNIRVSNIVGITWTP
jgi:hypothetical protein